VIPNPLDAWLDALRREGRNFQEYRYVIEKHADGTEGAHHRLGTIERLCEASADYCVVLESRAFEVSEAHSRVDKLASHLKSLKKEAEELFKPYLSDSSQAGETAPKPIAAEPTQPEGVKAVLRKRGEFWEIGHEGKTSNFQDIKGFHFISRLLREPRKEIPARELAARVNLVSEGVANDANLSSESASGGGFTIRDSLGVGCASNVDEVLDKTTLKEYRERLLANAKDRKEAEANHDLGRLAALDSETESIEEELSAATAIGGKTRRFVSPEDRARSNVTIQIRAAIKKISKANRELGLHLDNYIETGRWCSYNPGPSSNIRWIL